MFLGKQKVAHLLTFLKIILEFFLTPLPGETWRETFLFEGLSIQETRIPGENRLATQLYLQFKFRAPKACPKRHLKWSPSFAESCRDGLTSFLLVGFGTWTLASCLRKQQSRSQVSRGLQESTMSILHNKVKVQGSLAVFAARNLGSQKKSGGSSRIISC